MDSIDIVKAELEVLAVYLDSPEGPGSGAIALDALSEIESLERRIDPAEPGSI
ncbi:MAG TPA: hypothetical protein VHE81_06655 [Lacipirellulaceae bacterium]|nr:hypothetical protein [Lacipirellulaceae bacterium]